MMISWQLKLLSLALAVGHAVTALTIDTNLDNNVDVDPQSTYYDGESGIYFERVYEPSRMLTIGFVFPDYDSDEFVGLITAPRNIGWIGVSLGDPRIGSPLVLAWLDGTTPVASLRWATRYQDPEPYYDAHLTLLETSGLNSTHQRFLFRCQGCIAWDGGRFEPNGVSLLGWATSVEQGPTDPSNPESSIPRYDAQGVFDFDSSWARSGTYDDDIEPLTPGPVIITVTVDPPRPTGGTVTVTVTGGNPRPTTTRPGPITVTVTAGQSTSRPGQQPTRTVTVTAQPTRTLGPNDLQVEYGQCGGETWEGPTRCEAGLTCVRTDRWYSQCLRCRVTCDEEAN